MNYLSLLKVCGLLAAIGCANGCFIVNMDADGRGGTIKPVVDSDGNYLPNQNCYYTISLPIGQDPYGLLLWFTEMDLEIDDSWRPCKAESYSCETECVKTDHVVITDIMKKEEVTRRCGRNIPNYTYKTVSSAEILFKTDRVFQRTGFTLNFRIDPETEPCNRVYVVNPKDSGTVSNNVKFNGYYRPNENCRWKVSVPSKFDSIKFKFTKMDIDGSCSANSLSCNCPNDYVTVYDGDTEFAPAITTRCGFSVPAMNFYTNKSTTMFVQFRSSDNIFQYSGYTIEYEGCNQPCEVSTTPTIPTTTTPDVIHPFPREQDLAAFWPLGQKKGLKDASANKRHCESGCRGTIDQGPGPFGDALTSHHTPGANEPILSVGSVLYASDSFTVSLWVKVPKSAKGGLLSLVSIDQDFALDIETADVTNRPVLRVRGSSSTSADTYGPYEAIRPDTWTYLAVVFDAQMCALSIVGQFGELYMPSYKMRLCNNKNNPNRRGITVGATKVGQDTWSYLDSSVSVSCVMLYSAALSIDEIAHNADVCRIPHETAACGAPKIPLPTIPIASSTNPMYGQFPWMASIRHNNNHICGAAILDRFHLLTAASCFKESQTASDYTVRVGEHNLNLNEAYEAAHLVRRIMSHKDYNVIGNDVAVIEIEDEIDFSNFYVNTICLPSWEEAKKTDGTFYFFGWGKNGRSPQTSATVPRYVAGDVLASQACSDAWADGHDPALTACFETQATANRNVPCTGDEGGILMAPGNLTTGPNTRLYPVGIYSRRYNDDCQHKAPALFTWIEAYLYGIQEQMGCNLPGYFYPENCPINYS